MTTKWTTALNMYLAEKGEGEATEMERSVHSESNPFVAAQSIWIARHTILS